MSKITQRANSSEINCLEDIEPPFGSFLSGKYKRSFAYKTIKDRLPVILTKIIDTLSRDKDEISRLYDANALDEVKVIIGAISKLKNELVTNKAILPLIPLPDTDSDDALEWNLKIEKLSELQGEIPTWFNTFWLFSECYMYRRIAQEFYHTLSLKEYDPFESQKKEGYFKTLGSITHLLNNIMKLIDKNNEASANEHEENLVNLIKLNLWGNRCDLSLSTGVVSSQENNPLNSLQELDKEILVDNSKIVSELLIKNLQCGNNNSVIDIVLDNSGYELINDLCLAAYLIEKKLTNKVRFYVKLHPWFVSDVTTNDFLWLVKTMMESENENIKSFGNYCEKYLKTGSWTIERESFWTRPYDFSEMKTADPTLYKKLSESILVVFKGDLNYRKLLGDINWKYTTDFTQALRGFRPANLVSLRTIKADLCAGLPDGRAEEVKKEDPDWMTTGRWGLIQASIEIC